MQLVKQSHAFIDEIDGVAMLKKIERIARVCYKSEDKITETSYINMIKGLLARKHEAMLEHVSVSVLFITDRGVSHELVRHRMASFAQESTRYCNYNKLGLDFIIPTFSPAKEDRREAMAMWVADMEDAELAYTYMLSEKGYNLPPQDARSVLPNSLKTEIVVTANLREWRHILALRAVGITGEPHPQMKALMQPLLKDFQKKIPLVFDDLKI